MKNKTSWRSFIVWLEQNKSKLFDMYIQYQEDSEDDITLAQFSIYMWYEGQDVVEDFEMSVVV